MRVLYLKRKGTKKNKGIIMDLKFKADNKKSLPNITRLLKLFSIIDSNNLEAVLFENRVGSPNGNSVTFSKKFDDQFDNIRTTNNIFFNLEIQLPIQKSEFESKEFDILNSIAGEFLQYEAIAENLMTVQVIQKAGDKYIIDNYNPSKNGNVYSLDHEHTYEQMEASIKYAYPYKQLDSFTNLIISFDIPTFLLKDAKYSITGGRLGNETITSINNPEMEIKEIFTTTSFSSMGPIKLLNLFTITTLVELGRQHNFGFDSTKINNNVYFNTFYKTGENPLLKMGMFKVERLSKEKQNSYDIISHVFRSEEIQKNIMNAIDPRSYAFYIEEDPLNKEVNNSFYLYQKAPSRKINKKELDLKNNLAAHGKGFVFNSKLYIGENISKTPIEELVEEHYAKGYKDLEEKWSIFIKKFRGLYSPHPVNEFFAFFDFISKRLIPTFSAYNPLGFGHTHSNEPVIYTYLKEINFDISRFNIKEPSKFLFGSLKLDCPIYGFDNDRITYDGFKLSTSSKSVHDLAPKVWMYDAKYNLINVKNTKSGVRFRRKAIILDDTYTEQAWRKKSRWLYNKLIDRSTTLGTPRFLGSNIKIIKLKNPFETAVLKKILEGHPYVYSLSDFDNIIKEEEREKKEKKVKGIVTAKSKKITFYDRYSLKETSDKLNPSSSLIEKIEGNFVLLEYKASINSVKFKGKYYSVHKRLQFNKGFTSSIWFELIKLATDKNLILVYNKDIKELKERGFPLLEEFIETDEYKNAVSDFSFNATVISSKEVYDAYAIVRSNLNYIFDQIISRYNSDRYNLDVNALEELIYRYINNMPENTRKIFTTIQLLKHQSNARKYSSGLAPKEFILIRETLSDLEKELVKHWDNNNPLKMNEDHLLRLSKIFKDLGEESTSNFLKLDVIQYEKQKRNLLKKNQYLKLNKEEYSKKLNIIDRSFFEEIDTNYKIFEKALE
jgi:hypothetical protein